MPSTRESTQAITRPAGRSTRAISAIIVSAARCTDSARSSAMTPSAQPSARKVSRDESAITGMILPRGAARPVPPLSGGPSLGPRVPARPPGPAGSDHAQHGVPGLGGQFGARRARSRDVDEQVPAGGSHSVSWARVTASWNCQ